MSEPNATENPDVAFEKEDVRATPILQFLVGLAVTTVVVAFLLYGFYGAMSAYVASQQPAPPHMKFAPDRQPPLPLLQELPLKDVTTLRAEEDALLTTYGWVDKGKGKIRIPVAEAMRIIVDRGLHRSLPPNGGESGVILEQGGAAPHPPEPPPPLRRSESGSAASSAPIARPRTGER